MILYSLRVATWPNYKRVFNQLGYIKFSYFLNVGGFL